MVMINERPKEIDERVIQDHWEGNLVFGTKGQSAVATLVERQSRFLILIGLRTGRTTKQVVAAIARHLNSLPPELRRSLTWVQGKELADHRRLTSETGVPVFFCEPYSPWQRGSDENTNGLLRQYLPRSCDLNTFTQMKLNKISADLNSRPRQSLGWLSPSERFTPGVALTG